MPLIITPGQLAKRAELYQQLGQLTAAGVGVVRALEQLQRNPPTRSYREPLRQTIEHIGRGQTFTAAMQSTGDWLPAFDIALLQSGEQTGRLDASFRKLSVYYFDRARLARQMISQLLYPVGLIHFAALVFLVVLPYAGSGFNASPLILCVKAALMLSPLYVGVGLLIYAMQGKHGESWRALVESILHYVPLLGMARHDLSLARLATALEALISAGVNIVEAWSFAATASGSPAFKRIVAGWKSRLAAGQTPAQIIRDSPRFPEMFSNLYTTGEVSGKLDESLRKLHDYYQEEGARKLNNIANLLPKAIYLMVMLAIAYFIIQFYNHLYGSGSDLDKAINGFRN